MKKRIVILALFATTILNSSFARDVLNKNTAFTRPWSVSSYGFLVFPSILDIDQFIQFAQTKTHAEMQQYILDSLSGFSSLGSTLFSASDATITEAVAYNYALNTYRIMQTSGVIIKPVSERECSVKYEYILTLTPSNLNSTTYASLQNGTFDNNSMNKFATNQTTQSTPLAQFVSFVPYGHEDTQTPGCPDGNMPVAKISSYKYYDLNSFSASDMSVKQAGPISDMFYETSMNNLFKPRPFWGWGPESCVQDGEWFNAQTGQWVPRYSRCQTYYIFWIAVNTDCYFAYGCSGCPPHGNCNEQ